MFAFLMGILFDEALRRLVIPFFRRHPEHMQRLAHARRLHFMRGQLAGELDGLVGDLDTSDMHYMDREGPSAIDSGNPPDDVEPGESAAPFSDVAGAFLDELKDKVAKRAQDRIAEQIVSSLADDVTSGCLGAVDGACRRRLGQHLEWHRRNGTIAGWGIPGLNAVRRVGSFVWKHDPVLKFGRKQWGRLDAPINRGGGGGAPAPQQQDDAAPDGGDAPADATEGIMSKPINLQSPTGQMVTTLAGAALARARVDPAFRMQLGRRLRHFKRGRGAGGGWRGAHAATLGWSFPWSHAKGAASSPGGKLLISAVPGGASAQAAHAIASKALKKGDLKPAHLKAAGALTKRGRAGDKGALMKIAQIKRQAGRGDRNAELALDRIKLAHCIQTGQACGPGAGHGTMSRHYAAGAQSMTMHHRTHRF